MTNSTRNPFALTPCRWPGCGAGTSSNWTFPDDTEWVMCAPHTERFIQQWQTAAYVEPAKDERDHPWITDQQPSWFAGMNVQREQPRDNERMYYLLVGDAIKVGYTRDLQYRLTQYPPNAVLLAAHPGSKDDEQAFHQAHRAYRSHHKEWYRDCPEMRAITAAVVAEHGDPRLLAQPPHWRETQMPRLSSKTRSAMKTRVR